MQRERIKPAPFFFGKPNEDLAGEKIVKKLPALFPNRSLTVKSAVDFLIVFLRRPTSGKMKFLIVELV